MPIREKAQALPVLLYQAGDHIMVAAPMPGLEPGDIYVRISGRRVTIRSGGRSPVEPEHETLLAEWSPGPYYRELDLPHPVDGKLTNASYDNGVLVLSMLKLAPGKKAVAVTFGLGPVKSTRGQRIGHTSREHAPARRRREAARAAPGRRKA
jgi:HSP20 family protein